MQPLEKEDASGSSSINACKENQPATISAIVTIPAKTYTPSALRTNIYADGSNPAIETKSPNRKALMVL